MTPTIEITRLPASPDAIGALANILVEAVANGGSMSFMHPLAPETAAAFWARSLAAAEAGRRIVLGAWIAGELAGAVTLDLETPPNQPHRADIAKLMTALRWRGRGVARALMIEAERLAGAQGRTLLTLDTAEEDGAGGLYERLGFTFAGAIPDYAFKPRGGLTGTRIYFKRIGAGAGAVVATASA